MKYHTVLAVLLTWAYLLSACAAQPAGVEDQASFVTALKAAGASVEVGDTIIQDFFTPEGQILVINGADVQVFEYETTQAMEEEAAQVSPDGGSVGTTMMSWIDAPHFYKAGRIIVLYVGSDQPTLDLLEQVMGPQFAGR